MQIESVACNQCGAPLDIPESANFVRCNHCQAQLAIKRTTSATFTEQVGELARKTDRMLEHLQDLAYRNKLSELDRRWEREKQSYMIRDDRGRTHEPTEVGIVLAGVVTAIIAFFSLASGAWWFALIVIPIGSSVAYWQYHKMKEYHRARRRHQRRRRSVTRESVLNEDPQWSSLQNVHTPAEFLEVLEETENPEP